jgi:DNA-binding transcriptional ArsR family regulator
MDALQIVSEPRRRQILRLVWDRELSAGEIADRFDVTFGAVSQHLAILRGAGFVRARRDGNRRLYVADRERLGPLARMLEAMWSEALDRLAHAVEAEAGDDRAERAGERDTS